MTADKRRTDACLKACEGISTQNLENNVPFLELARRYNVVLRERKALRAKIEQMEQQEPFDADSDVFRGAFEAALKAGNWPATRQGDGYRSPSTQIAWRIAFSTVNRLKLYLAPGAQPAPSVPDAWKLVPIEPTEAMVTAFAELFNVRDQKNTFGPAFRAALAAAPEAKP